MTIRPATNADIPLIHDIAHETWWSAYKNILSNEQISFMLDDMYSESALARQFEEGIHFLISSEGELTTGFAAYSPNTPGVLRIHKLYVLPSGQGKGCGRQMLDYISALALNQGVRILELNVNRANPARHFYENYGFHVWETVDLPYFHFTLNDFVLRKELQDA